jgi:hypothetical protein
LRELSAARLHLVVEANAQGRFAARGHLGIKPGRHLAYRLTPAGQQPVHVIILGCSRSALRLRWQAVALEDKNLIEAVPQRSRGAEAADPGAYDSHAPTERR